MNIYVTNSIAYTLCPAPLMIMSFENVNIMLIFISQKGFKYYRAFTVKIISFVTNSSRLHRRRAI